MYIEYYPSEFSSLKSKFPPLKSKILATCRVNFTLLSSSSNGMYIEYYPSEFSSLKSKFPPLKSKILTTCRVNFTMQSLPSNGMYTEYYPSEFSLINEQKNNRHERAVICCNKKSLGLLVAADRSLADQAARNDAVGALGDSEGRIAEAGIALLALFVYLLARLKGL